jgi:FAD/FMN-containing dehydrogenase
MTPTPYVKIPVKDSTIQIPSFLQGFNQRWFASNCESVYLCYTAEGTAAALEDAISHYGSDVKIKGGGHCYENFVFNEHTKAIIDVGPMGAAGYDEEKGFFLESGGTNWTAFKRLFRDYGKVLPAGSCYSVGLGGHICGGGYGLLSRLNGLTVDWLTGVEVAVKDDANQAARLVYASKSSTGDEQDLFWAHCGGGGGNFGVITKYYFKELPDAPQRAFLTTLAFDWKDLSVDTLEELLSWYAEFAERKDNWNQFGLFKLMHHSNGEIQLVIQTAVDNHIDRKAVQNDLIEPQLAELHAIYPHQKVQTPIIGYGGIHIHPTAARTLDYTFYEAVQILNGSGANQRGKYKSAYMRKAFPRDQVSAIHQHLQITPPGLDDADMKQSLLQVDTYGGQINTVASDATAIAQRDSIMKLQYQTYWPEPANDAAHLQWMADFYSAVYAQTGKVPNPAQDDTHTVDGCYYNYCDSDLNEIVGREGALRLYFLGNLKRLVKTKNRWDPNNYFNSAQSIPTHLEPPVRRALVR